MTNRKYTLRSLLIITFTLSLLVLPRTSVRADSNTLAFETPEGITFHLPSYQYGLNANSPWNASAYQIIGLRRDDVNRYIKQANLAMMVFHKDMEYFYTVRIEDTSLTDSNRLDNDSLLKREESYYQQYNDDEIQFDILYTFNVNPQSKFVLLSCYEDYADGQYMESVIYTTVFDDIRLEIQLFINDPDALDRIAVEMMQVIQTIELPIPNYTTSSPIEDIVSSSDMTVHMPLSLKVLHQDFTATDPIIEMTGLSPLELRQYMINNNIHWIALDDDGLYEINIVKTNSAASYSIYDMKNAPYADLIKEDSDYDYLNMLSDDLSHRKSIYENDWGRFVQRTYRSSFDESAFHVLQYETVYGGSGYTFTLFSYNDILSPRQEAILQYIVDHIKIDPPKRIEPTQEVTIHDHDISMQVPSSMFIYTQDPSENPYPIEMLTLDPKQYYQQMQDNQCYLSIYPKDLGYRIQLTIQPAYDPIHSLNELSDDQVIDYARSLCARSQIEYDKIHSFNYQGKLFAAIEYGTLDDGVLYPNIEYITVHNGQLISIVLNSYTDVLTPQMKLTMIEIASSIELPPSESHKWTPTSISQHFIPTGVLMIMDGMKPYSSFLAIILTIVICYVTLLPSVVYRYGIINRPVRRRFAITYTIAYCGILTVGLLFTSRILSAVYITYAMIPLSIIHYLILSLGHRSINTAGQDD